MRRTLEFTLPALLVALAAPVTIVPLSAAGQQPGSNEQWIWQCKTYEAIKENYIKCTGHAEFEQGGTKLYADEVEWFKDQDRLRAAGNVVLTQGKNQIAADRADFNMKTRLGTFYSAQGFASAKTPRQTVQTAQPGYNAPQMPGQENDVYYFGEVIEKIGPKRYKIKNGGFTLCVQPTPRWDLHSGTVVVDVDHYTMARNALFNVKGVPVLYLPYIYYPTNEQGRATGFLFPTYGYTSSKGNSIGNQFFWAIDRSQDATITHEWFSKIGNGLGAEYRYAVASGGGRVNTYFLDKSITLVNGAATPAERSVRVDALANHTLNGRWRTSVFANYFSSIATNQTFNTNLQDFSANERRYGGNIAGNWRSFNVNGQFDRKETFNSLATSAVLGNSPRVAVTRGEQPLFSRSSPLYFGFTGEYAHVDRQTKSGSLVTDDRTLGRADFAPRVRYPFKKWQWMTVNTQVDWRDTYYTRSQDPATRVVLGENLNRQYATFTAAAVGPVLNRVWDTPGNGYAEKFKHTIEPYLTFSRTTTVDKYNHVVEGVDTPIPGGTTNYVYGVNNRFYAKRKVGPASQSQEILRISLGQTYYTNTQAAQVDPGYQSSFNGGPPSHFSPLKLDVTVTPDPSFRGGMQAEFDTRYGELKNLSANGQHLWSRGATQVSWSQQFFTTELAQLGIGAIRRSLSIGTNAHTRDNRYGSSYSISLDAVASEILQQTFSAFYNAQCCGFAFRYLKSNHAIGPSPQDHGFSISVTLAGLGSFSPLGGMSGLPR